MASKHVSILKFVGTVSVGLLTGVSFTLGAVLAPPLLKLESASSAWETLCTIAPSATKHLNALNSIAGSAFLLAFTLSPSGLRHPYLLYTTGFVLTARLAPLCLGSSPSAAGGLLHQRRAAAQRRVSEQQRARAERERAAAARRMEASYEVLGASDVAAQSDEELAALAASEELEAPNGELIRRDVEQYARSQLVQALVAGVGFAMAVVGIWGDGVYDVAGGAYIIEI